MDGDYVKKEEADDAATGVSSSMIAHAPRCPATSLPTQLVPDARKRSPPPQGGQQSRRRVNPPPPPSGDSSSDNDDDDDNSYGGGAYLSNDDDDDPPPPPPRGGRGRPPPPPRNGRRGSPGGSPLPMPHNGAPPAEAAEDGAESVVHVYSPMWTTLFRETNTRPAPRCRCWGCRRGALNIAALPYEGYTKLTQELPNKVIEHGLYAAAQWAGTYYREEVLSNIIADPATLAQSQWDGVSIVWHFFKHTHIAQFRALGEQLELEYASDILMTERLYQMPQFGNPDKDVTVDPVTIKALAPLRSMLDRQRKTDVRKTANYHPGMGTGNKSGAAPFAKDRFTGRGLLHQ